MALWRVCLGQGGHRGFPPDPRVAGISPWNQPFWICIQLGAPRLVWKFLISNHGFRAWRGRSWFISWSQPLLLILFFWSRATGVAFETLCLRVLIGRFYLPWRVESFRRGGGELNFFKNSDEQQILKFLFGVCGDRRGEIWCMEKSKWNDSLTCLASFRLSI